MPLGVCPGCGHEQLYPSALHGLDVACEQCGLDYATGRGRRAGRRRGRKSLGVAWSADAAGWLLAALAAGVMGLAVVGVAVREAGYAGYDAADREYGKFGWRTGSPAERQARLGSAVHGVAFVSALALATAAVLLLAGAGWRSVPARVGAAAGVLSVPWVVLAGFLGRLL